MKNYNNKQKSVPKIRDYGDPTEVYLKSLFRVHILSRGQETQQAILMQYALHEMLDIAFRDSGTLQKLEILLDRLVDNSIGYNDIVIIDETSCKNPKKQQELINLIKLIIAEQKKVTILKRCLCRVPDDIEFTNLVEDIEDSYVSLCHSIQFNNKWVQDILKTFKSKIIRSSDYKNLEEFNRWVDVYDKAKAILVESNVRLVVVVAKRYINCGLDLSDLLQEGNKGLIIAVENFDYSRGNKLSTFAIWWIRQAVIRSLNEKSRTIHVPVNVIAYISKVDSFIEEYLNKFRVYPSISIIAKGLGISEDKALCAHEYSLGMVYLDSDVDPMEGTHVLDLIEDTTVESPLDKLSYESLCTQINKMLSALSKKEKKAIEMRFGLDDGRIKTLEEISGILKLTNERVRQIVVKALSKLKGKNYNEPVLPWKDST